MPRCSLLVFGCSLILGLLTLHAWAPGVPAGEPRAGAEEGRAAQPPILTNRERDDDLEDIVVTRLAFSPALATSDIEVEVAEGIVTLRGRVPSEGARLRAVRIARWTPSILDVRDELRIDPSLAAGTEPRVDDAELAKRVSQALVRDVFPGATAREDWLFGWEVNGNGFEFDVEVDDGRVTLQGVVPSGWAIPRLILAARDVPGVRGVVSQLSSRDEPWL